MEEIIHEDSTNICKKLSENAEYKAYVNALKTANRAVPKDIPKADGLLKHAENMLNKAIQNLGLNPQNSTLITASLKAMAQNDGRSSMPPLPAHKG